MAQLTKIKQINAIKKHITEVTEYLLSSEVQSVGYPLVKETLSKCELPIYSNKEIPKENYELFVQHIETRLTEMIDFSEMMSESRVHSSIIKEYITMLIGASQTFNIFQECPADAEKAYILYVYLAYLIGLGGKEARLGVLMRYL